MTRRTRSYAQAARKPVAQLGYAAVLALAGAWLIAIWAVGVVLIVFAALLAADALLRDDATPEDAPTKTTHDEILERWRNMR